MRSNVKTQKFKIEGMTCVSCENRIEKKLNSLNGITTVDISYTSGFAVITYDAGIIRLEKIVSAIEKLDYKVVKDVNIPFHDKKSTKYQPLIGVGIILIALHFIINHFGGLSIFNQFPQANEDMGFGMLFLIGVLTSLHCVAMCGGINLSQCIPQNINPGKDEKKLADLVPSLLYNFGRVISYTVIGGIVGAIGSVISFSGTAKGILQLGAGVFMVIMGLNMLNLFPWLRKLNPRMPKIFARKINEQKKSRSPLYVGLLNGLMPCGPLQAMQFYALSTGSAWKGALSMLVFSLGTVPLMFGLGAISSLLSKRFTHKMMTVSAGLVVILGIFMFSSGLSLSGFALPSVSGSSGVNTKDGNKSLVTNGVQSITTKLSSGSYEPITIQKGIPVKWIIQAKSSDINGCNNELVIPKFNVTKKLAAGDNIIEFTPAESGTFAYSCWMGMIRSKITVVDNLNKNDTSSDDSVKKYVDRIPVDKIAVAEIEDGKQHVEIDMNENGFSPAVVVMQSGIDTQWTINGINLRTDNNSIFVPDYNAKIPIRQGANPLNLNPEKDFEFTSVDHSFFGYVKVVQDLSKIDIDVIKSETSKFEPTAQQPADNTEIPSCH